MAADTISGLRGGEGLSIRFPAGLPAFEHETAFVLLAPAETAPIVLLQSATNPGLCFLTVPVDRVAGHYDVSLSAEDLENLGCSAERVPAPEDILVLAIL